jgi:hypothetical protein
MNVVGAIPRLIEMEFLEEFRLLDVRQQHYTPTV